jgi:hypothetical protein
VPTWDGPPGSPSGPMDGRVEPGARHRSNLDEGKRMELQQDVLTWLIILPLVLAAFRVITIGDRLYEPTATGRPGGESSAQSSVLMGGLVFVGIAVVISNLSSELLGRLGIGVLMLSFGAFILSHYILGFRRKVWHSFLGAALQEAAYFWLVIGVARVTLDSGATGDQSEVQAAIWVVVVTVSVALIAGTAARMFRPVQGEA